MTEDTVTDTTPAVAAPYAATLQHIELLADRRTRLLQAQYDAERQVIHRIATDYQEGRLTLAELIELYELMRKICQEQMPTQRIGVRWEEGMPFGISKMRAEAQKQIWHAPNSDGNWTGTNPLGEGETYPAKGQSVVYVLFDDKNEPCYVGSSQSFKSRLRAHRSDGKPFVRWAAYPCADREAAYVLEDRLLKEHKPYLNGRAGR